MNDSPVTTPRLPPSLPTELVLLILHQHLLDLHDAFLHPSPPTTPPQSNGTLSFLLASSHLHTLLLPLLYAHPILSTPSQTANLLSTLARSPPHLLALPNLLRSISYRGEITTRFGALLSAFGDRVERLELVGVPAEVERAAAGGGGGASPLWGVMSCVDPVWAEVGLVIKGKKGGMRKRRGSGKRERMVKREREREAVPIAVVLDGDWEERNQEEKEGGGEGDVGGRVWEVVQMGVSGWKRWTEGGVEIREIEG